MAVIPFRTSDKLPGTRYEVVSAITGEVRCDDETLPCVILGMNNDDRSPQDFKAYVSIETRDVLEEVIYALWLAADAAFGET